ncbi:MAG: winged helix-turn-helix transcriptional regulator, partial [Oscillospiraceae bacterium]|nr:winged helix-turn-helix transcriptional regulator [Oscillospiraceae bacterium]
SAVWGWDFVGETRTVDVHVQRLRAKLGPERIETVYKYGYRWQGGAAAGSTIFYRNRICNFQSKINILPT